MTVAIGNITNTSHMTSLCFKLWNTHLYSWLSIVKLSLGNVCP